MFRTLKREKGFYRYLIALAMPIILQNLVTTSLGLVDTFMVGLVGTVEMAAVTAANTPIFVLQCVIFGLQSGLGILVGQYWGKRDMEYIRRSVSIAYWLVFAVTIVASLLCLFCPGVIIRLVTDNEGLVPLASQYLGIVGCSYLFNGFSMIYIAAQRSMENPKLGMYALSFSMVLNVILDYLLIFGKCGLPALGVIGAAWATFLARVAEALVLVVHAILHKDQIPLEFSRLFHVDWSLAKVFIKYSTPVMIGELLWVLGYSMTSVILGHMANSTDMLAAYAIAKNIHNLTTVFCFGLSGAVAVIMGKRIGEHLSWQTLYDTGICLMLVSVLVGLVIAALLLLLMPTVMIPFLFPMFNLTAESIDISIKLSYANFITIPFFAFNNSMVIGVLRAGGDVRAATVIDTLPQWVLSIPLTALCALVWHSSIWVIAFAIHAENLLKFPLGILRIKQAKWIKDVTEEVRS